MLLFFESVRPGFANSPVLLQSLEEKEKEEVEGKNKQEGSINVQNASSCTDEAPEGQGSLSEGPFKSADIKNKQRFDERDPKLQCHLSPNTLKDGNLLSFHVKQRRFMIYLCGGYKGEVDGIFRA